ncbi:amino acid permease [Nocardiopsis sp. CNT-189]|uniref:APC family permease n=1 Tax=Nocardiopsis oceanisediminis TaxID=2816862 RepID=UPI003B3841D3
MKRGYRLGPAAGTALYLGAVLGPGVLALPALAARTAGPASLLAWLFLLCASVPVSATFAALGARYPDGGGVATFAARAFGPRAAAAVGWWFFAAVPVGVLAAAVIGGRYAARALGLGDGAVLVTAGLLLGAGFAVNRAGLHVSGRLQLLLAGLLVLLLLVAVGFSAPGIEPGNFTPFAPHGWWAVGGAAGALFFAFAGWEAASHLSGEFADPGRDLPRVTLWTVAIVGVLYLGLALATVGVLGAEGARSQVPLLLLMEEAFGPVALALTSGAALLLTFGAINAYIASGARLGAALGRDGGFPRWFDDGTRAGDVPRRSLGVLAGCCAVLGAATAAFGTDLDALLRGTASCLAAVTVTGTAAAVRLLPGRPLRACAVAASLLVGAVLLFTGALMALPLLLGACALLYVRFGGGAGATGRGGALSGSGTSACR